jgi:AcrR family transcriptional regulator
MPARRLTTRVGKSSNGNGRERILRVAIRHFADRGFDGTTTVAVAREARVTQPDVHHHFGSKQKLWEAAVDEVFSRLSTLAQMIPGPGDDPVTAANKVLAQLVTMSSNASRAREDHRARGWGAVADARVSPSSVTSARSCASRPRSSGTRSERA